METLGKLVQGDLRKIWESEARDFTTWLAKQENLELLSDEIGIEISLIQTEANVGTFHLDILAKEANSDRTIIIENQLEGTDHDHLGKLITYASGSGASIVIWIVKDVREEHKQAIDWLNEHTDKDINFFIIKMEVWKINDSPYAPKFHIVSEPNDWAKAIKTSVSEIELTNIELLQLEYWTKFKEFAFEKKTRLKLRKPQPQSWFEIAIGNAESYIALTVNKRDELIGCEIYIPEYKELFHYLLSKKTDIENDLGMKLEWMELPDRKASRIRIQKNIDYTDSKNWKECFDWMLKNAELFYTNFKKYIDTSSLI
jgi:hypothetical protein